MELTATVLISLTRRLITSFFLTLKYLPLYQYHCHKNVLKVLMYTNQLFYKICPTVSPNSKGNYFLLLMLGYKDKTQM